MNRDHRQDRARHGTSERPKFSKLIVLMACCVLSFLIGGMLWTVRKPAVGGVGCDVGHGLMLLEQDGSVRPLAPGEELGEREPIAYVSMAITHEFERGQRWSWPLPMFRYQRSHIGVQWIPDDSVASEGESRNGVTVSELLEAYRAGVTPETLAKLEEVLGRYGCVKIELHNRQIWWPGVRYNLARLGSVGSAAIAVLFLFASGREAHRRWLIRRRSQRRQCEQCGYDLTNITSQRCPECGSPVGPHQAEQ